MSSAGIANKILKFLASLKLAVFIILAVGGLSAWGTIVESMYNSRIATMTVYHSPYMVATLGLLVVNLIAVIVDRYPWKKHHLGFILAHIGIIILIIGSVLTHKLGIDGSMRLGIGETDRYVSIPTTDFVVWATFDGDSFAKIYEKEVNFFLDPPSEKNPLEVSLPDSKLRVFDYIPFALEERQIVASDEKGNGPALRFQLENANVNLSQWIQMKEYNSKPSIMNLGPAKVVLHSGNYEVTGDNEILLKASADKKYLEYEIHSKRAGKKTLKGRVASGQTIETGWMGLKFRLLKYLPQSKEEIIFHRKDRPTDLTRAAIHLEYKDKKYWMAQDSMMKFFSDAAGFIVTYGRRRIDIGFDLKLLKFNIDRYQGTRRAATYESDVLVPGQGEVKISMNEPLKHNGLTFYQSSFQEDEETGEPTASILSVNRDPGRELKYLGSLLIVLGSIVMFYFKRSLFMKKKGTAS